MIERWFITYKSITHDFIDWDKVSETFGHVVTDVSPARWTLYARLKYSRDHYVLYAEEISPALAVELVHGGAGVETDYYREVDPDETPYI